MIKNNFNELVAQRKLKITRVSNDTGISRPTLNALTRDDGKGIQYDTLNLSLIHIFSPAHIYYTHMNPHHQSQQQLTLL